MKRARRCRKCGCTDRKACVEFDETGEGYCCFWVAKNLCSACVDGDAVQARLLRAGLIGPQVAPFVVAPELRGYVARPR